MIIVLKGNQHQSLKNYFERLHQLRHNVFCKRLKWKILSFCAREYDDYDTDDTYYLVGICPKQGIYSSVRFVPTTSAYMAKDIFSELIDQHYKLPDNPHVWESSRLFNIDSQTNDKRNNYTRLSTLKMFIAMLEFCLYKNISWLITVTDLRVEKIYQYAGWPLQRLGDPKKYDDSNAVCGLQEVSYKLLQKMRKALNIHMPVLWIPHQTTLL